MQKQHKDEFKQYATLSAREAQLLQLAFKGLTNQQIASEMNIKLGSTYKVWANIYFKLGVNSARQALCAAMHLRLVHIAIIAVLTLPSIARNRTPTRPINRPVCQLRLTRKNYEPA